MPPAAMLWNKVMSIAHEGLENKDFLGLSSADMKSATVCTKSGMLATDLCTACGHVQTVLMPEEQVPTEECTMHVRYQVCVHTDALSAPVAMPVELPIKFDDIVA